MKNTVLVILLIVLTVGIGTYIFLKQSETRGKSTVNMSPEATKPVMTAPTNGKKFYSLEQISQHNKSTDCWLAIEGKVYDVTGFVASGKHPGGDAILQGCGKDATTLFNTRPMGSGTPHSEKARNNLINFYIGELQ